MEGSTMTDPVYTYDMIVIGSGPAGQRAAIQAAKLDKRVAIIERKTVVGGVSVNTGTIPSKTLREAVMYLSGYQQRSLYGASYTVKEKITMSDLIFRTDHVMRTEIDVVRAQLMRNGVDMIAAEAVFIEAHTLRLNYFDGQGQRDISGQFIVIATGTTVTRGDNIPFDDQDVFTSDDILHLDSIPRTMSVVGAGVIGCEYATMFAALGVRVTIVDKRPDLLSFIDTEIVEELIHQMRENRITLRLGEEVSRIEIIPRDGNVDEKVKLQLASGKQIITQKALYSIGRTGATKSLNLEAAGIKMDDRGRLKVNEAYQTNVSHIYAVGDVIGFPSLASTSMEQGRLASCHAFGLERKSIPELFPYGVYTIPEISMVGKTEKELTDAGIPYEIGKAQYREIARGQILGDHNGLLKLIFHLETHELLGIHIIGTGASELIHIGQAVLAFGGKVDYFVNTVFNYPTLAECYKTAAFDGLNRLG
jgi:NAD(P) transhydrogenase